MSFKKISMKHYKKFGWTIINTNTHGNLNHDTWSPEVFSFYKIWQNDTKFKQKKKAPYCMKYYRTVFIAHCFLKLLLVLKISYRLTFSVEYVRNEICPMSKKKFLPSTDGFPVQCTQTKTSSQFVKQNFENELVATRRKNICDMKSFCLYLALSLFAAGTVRATSATNDNGDLRETIKTLQVNLLYINYWTIKTT